MGETVGRHRYTWAEFLDFEAASNVKHEYLEGEIYGMAGGTPEHARLSVNVSALFHGKLRDRPCRVYSSDLRVRVEATGLATYPDVTVVCGEPRSDPESEATIVNPTLVVEVLSESTRDYDRGEKLAHYRRIPTLETVVVVWQDRPLVEVTDARDGSLRTFGAGDSFEALGATFAVDDVYA